jgi:hypothetical protein
LDEQDWQTTEGVFDPEKLAMVYQQVTYKWWLIATMLGIADEESLNRKELYEQSQTRTPMLPLYYISHRLR